MAGKHLAFIGDSTMRQIVMSLACFLADAQLKPTKVRAVTQSSHQTLTRPAGVTQSSHHTLRLDLRGVTQSPHHTLSGPAGVTQSSHQTLTGPAGVTKSSHHPLTGPARCNTIVTPEPHRTCEV
eukprot:1184601-Prorocentrum_minimum.AAC.4